MELLVNCKCTTGECPIWHEGALYWCDIPAGIVYRWQSGESEIFCRNPYAIGGFTFESDGSLLCFLEKGAVARWHKGAWQEILPPQKQLVEDRFNDVIAQSDGSVLCGTMPDKNGNAQLFRLDHRLKLELVFDNIKLSNGLAFSPDLSYLYYADTRNYALYRCPYDWQKGYPGAIQLLVDFHKRAGRPDGITVDRHGNIWVAEIGASQIVRFDKEGKELECIKVPAPRVTSLSFGGDNYREIFITSGTFDSDTPAEAGATFIHRADAVGLAEFSSSVVCH